MPKPAEFRISIGAGTAFYACWPKNADPRGLRAAGHMLAELLNWWADTLNEQSSGNAEYASWFPALPSGVKATDGGKLWYGEHGWFVIVRLAPGTAWVRPDGVKTSVAPRFDKTYCSQCGGEFGPGDQGYSHCEDHDPPPCETCGGEGTIDERLGGYSFSNPAATCPDCDGTGEAPHGAAIPHGVKEGS